MSREQIKAFRALIAAAPNLNIDDAQFALEQSTRICDEYLRSEAVLSALPDASPQDASDELVSRLADAAGQHPAATRAWVRLQHLDMTHSYWKQLVAVLDEDRKGGVANWG